jgi:hypothetical protein
MAKDEKPKPEEKPEEKPLTDEEEVFQQYGIDEDDDKRRVRVFAASRALHARRSAPKPEEKKKKESIWEGDK